MRSVNLLARAAFVACLGVMIGCGTDQMSTAPTANTAQPDLKAVASAAAAAPGLAVCNQQTYATGSLRIGVNGGKLKVGRHEFEVPRGALSSPVTITMTAVADSVHSVRFSPEGLVFNAGSLPVLKLDYKGCRIPHGSKWKIAYVTEGLRIVDMLGSVDDSVNTDVGGHVKHFSRYAVAY